MERSLLDPWRERRTAWRSGMYVVLHCARDAHSPWSRTWTRKTMYLYDKLHGKNSCPTIGKRLQPRRSVKKPRPRFYSNRKDFVRKAVREMGIEGVFDSVSVCCMEMSSAYWQIHYARSHPCSRRHVLLCVTSAAYRLIWNLVYAGVIEELVYIVYVGRR